MSQDRTEIVLSGDDIKATLSNISRNDSSDKEQSAKIQNNGKDARNKLQDISITSNSDKVNNLEARKRQQSITVGRFFSVCIVGSLEVGQFEGVNDVYVKYTIIAGPDWILTSGSDVGITQISRYRLDSDGARKFVWNQPIAISYRSYNYFGWPQIVVSVYNFDTFGNDQLLGYGCVHLPVASQCSSNKCQSVKIYSPQSTSYLRQIISWLTGRKPELVDSNLFARGDCRKVLQTVLVGNLELSVNLTTKDVASNSYRS